MDRLQKDLKRYLGITGSAFWDQICIFLPINPSKFENSEKMFWGIKSNSRETDQKIHSGEWRGIKPVLWLFRRALFPAVVSTFQSQSVTGVNTHGRSEVLRARVMRTQTCMLLFSKCVRRVLRWENVHKLLNSIWILSRAKPGETTSI